MKTTKPKYSAKPILPLRKSLWVWWCTWLMYRFFVYPVLVWSGQRSETLGTLAMGMLWQVVVLLPACLVTLTIKKGDSAYVLMIANMITLVYLAAVGVFLFKYLYEGFAPLVSLGFGVEFGLLAVINVQLFLLLKRLPPMHKTRAIS